MNPPVCPIPDRPDAGPPASASSAESLAAGRGARAQPGSLRIQGGVSRGAAVSLLVDGQPVEAFEGESVAAALYATGRRELRHSPRSDLPRGLFCLMGSCQECLVWSGVRKLPSCQLPVTAGLVVETLGFRGRGHG
ncbi:MAG: (2Fe-2S)-binding protein [Polaromonas sp.]|nr:(2Fe-2S)-binding protein [Polaromonas sp.]